MPKLRPFIGFDEVQWRGAKFKLKQKYLDYEEYKKDINQLAPDEVERAKHFMLAISTPKFTGSVEDLIRALSGMQFPGFGSHYNGGVKDEHGARYILFEFEIPQKQELRTLLYRVDGDGACHRVLDGVSVDQEEDHLLGDSETKVENGKLKHLYEGKMYREIALDPVQ